MMKKWIAVLLLVIIAVSFTACSSQQNSQTSSSETDKTYTGSLEELIEKMYEQAPVEFMVAPATQIDLTNTDSLKSFIGLSDATGIKEAVYSESMIGAQAYSLCVVRTTEDADTQTIAESIFNQVDQSKWICVTADQLIVATYGDVILMVMVDSQLSTTLPTQLKEAFANVCGGELDKVFERTGE